MSDDMSSTARLVVGLEQELQTSACRADASRLRQLLAPDFVEIGASGRRWDLESVLELVAAETSTDVAITMTEVEHRVLAPTIIQLFWDSERDGRRARRTSIWRERRGEWQQVYHQGTLI